MAKQPQTMHRPPSRGPYPIGPGLHYGTVHWEADDVDVKSPPVSGQSHAFLIDNGGKMVTLFCPFTLESVQVPRSSPTVTSMGMDRRVEQYEGNPLHFRQAGFEPWDESRGRRLLETILSNWAMAQRLSLSGRDFDVAAMVITALGGTVPLSSSATGGETKVRGGKEAGLTGLVKPVKPDSKRGKVLAFFLPEPRSIREAMAHFGDSRSNVLSHLFMLKKDHGIGYALTGDAATVLLPAGCTDPFTQGAGA